MTGPDQRNRRGRSARERAAREEASRQAWIEHRRILVDELVQHPDVWEYIAEQAREVAADLPLGDDRTTLTYLALSADVVARMLERAQATDEQAAS